MTAPWRVCLAVLAVIYVASVAAADQPRQSAAIDLVIQDADLRVTPGRYGRRDLQADADALLVKLWRQSSKPMPKRPICRFSLLNVNAFEIRYRCRVFPARMTVFGIGTYFDRMIDRRHREFTIANRQISPDLRTVAIRLRRMVVSCKDCPGPGPLIDLRWPKFDRDRKPNRVVLSRPGKTVAKRLTAADLSVIPRLISGRRWHYQPPRRRSSRLYNYFVMALKPKNPMLGAMTDYDIYLSARGHVTLEFWRCDRRIGDLATPCWTGSMRNAAIRPPAKADDLGRFATPMTKSIRPLQGYMTVVGNSNLRSSPSRRGKRLAVIPGGGEVRVIGTTKVRQGLWFKVAYSVGTQAPVVGFVAGSLVRDLRKAPAAVTRRQDRPRPALFRQPNGDKLWSFEFVDVGENRPLYRALNSFRLDPADKARAVGEGWRLPTLEEVVALWPHLDQRRLQLLSYRRIFTRRPRDGTEQECVYVTKNDFRWCSIKREQETALLLVK
jgi:hypothetical protein